MTGGTDSFLHRWLPEIMATLVVANAALVYAVLGASGREAWGIVPFTALALGWAIYVRYDVGYDEDGGRDGLSEEELADVVVHLHDYLELSSGDIAACMPRSRSEIRDYYDEHPMAGEIEPKSTGEWR